MSWNKVDNKLKETGHDVKAWYLTPSTTFTEDF